ELPSTRIDKLPRMADFALWVAAAEKSLGWQPNTFAQAYKENSKDANELALEGSPLVQPLRRFLEGQRGKFEDTPSALLTGLKGTADSETLSSKEWPKRPNTLSNRLRRLAPNLRKAGVRVEFDRKAGGSRERFIRASLDARSEIAEERPSPSSPPS